jgi:hypothetical protein
MRDLRTNKKAPRAFGANTEQGPRFSLGALRDETLAMTCCVTRLRRQRKTPPFWGGVLG